MYWYLDRILNLDNLLIQICHEVTPKWYQFGLAIEINKEILDQFSNFPPEECIVEMSDLWLRTNETAVTWRDVAERDWMSPTGWKDNKGIQDKWGIHSVGMDFHLFNHLTWLVQAYYRSQYHSQTKLLLCKVGMGVPECYRAGDEGHKATDFQC